MAKPRTSRRRATVVQPQARSLTNWTPALLKRALYSADAGELRTVSELFDWVLGDERVKTGYKTRCGGLLGLELGFEEARPFGRRKPGKPGSSRRSDVVRALEDDGDFWVIWPEDEALQILTWAHGVGVCPIRLEWPESPDQRTGRIVPTARFWSPRWLRQDPQTGTWFVKHGTHGQNEEEITEGSSDWLLYRPHGLVRPWAHGDWRGLARWVLVKAYAADDWGRLGENTARLVGVASEKAKATDRATLAQELHEMGREGIVILPNGFDLKSVEKSANTRQLYEGQIEGSNRAIDIAIQGQNLTTEVQGGSFAAAKVHGKVAQDRIESDAESESTFLHTGPLALYAEVNFGDATKAPWPDRNTEPPADVATDATTTKTVAESIAILEGLGIEVDLEQARERFKLPITGKRIAKPVAPAPPKPAPPAPGGEDDGDMPPPADDDEPKAARPRAYVGDRPMAASGFVEGQGYADALIDRGVERVGAALQPFADDLGKLVDGIKDYEGARRKVLDFFRDSVTPEEASELTEKLFMMAHLGGHLSVRQDAPEIEA